MSTETYPVKGEHYDIEWGGLQLVIAHSALLQPLRQYGAQIVTKQAFLAAREQLSEDQISQFATGFMRAHPHVTEVDLKAVANTTREVANIANAAEAEVLFDTPITELEDYARSLARPSEDQLAFHLVA